MSSKIQFRTRLPTSLKSTGSREGTDRTQRPHTHQAQTKATSIKDAPTSYYSFINSVACRVYLALRQLSDMIILRSCSLMWSRRLTELFTWSVFAVVVCSWTVYGHTARPNDAYASVMLGDKEAEGSRDVVDTCTGRYFNNMTILIIKKSATDAVYGIGEGGTGTSNHLRDGLKT